MPKFLITADVHIHTHKKSSERLNDCLKAFDWIFKVAKDKNASSVLVLGDIFHDRQKIDILTYKKTFDIIREHCEKSNLKLYLLLGNHDLWHRSKWDISSICPLDGVHNVSVIDRPCTILIDGFPVSFLPYTDNPLSELQNIKNDHDVKVLCAHIALDGAVLNVMHGTHSETSIEHDGEMVKVDADAFRNWNFVFLGHYHACQKIDFNIEYVGSPLQLSFGEAFQHKHVIIFDTETYEKEYIRNTFSPQHLIVPREDLEKYELKNNFIKIIVEDASSSDMAELKKDLVDNHKVGSFSIVCNPKPQEKIIEDVKAILVDQSKIMSEYIKQLKIENKLDNLDESILEEVLEKIMKSEGQ